MAITVSQLNVFPVKGLKGIAVESAAATERGLEHDRRFVVVDSAGRFLSQRELPLMATVWTEIAAGELLLASPDHDEIAVPLEPAGGEPVAATLWEGEYAAIAPSPEADRWLSGVLGRPCRLAYMPASTRRASSPRYAGPDRLVSFADGYAFLVVSEASLAELNGRLARPVPMDRFRANIVVSGCGPFAEDGWGELRGRLGKAAYGQALRPLPGHHDGPVHGRGHRAGAARHPVGLADEPGVRGALRNERRDDRPRRDPGGRRAPSRLAPVAGQGVGGQQDPTRDEGDAADRRHDSRRDAGLEARLAEQKERREEEQKVAIGHASRNRTTLLTSRHNGGAHVGSPDPACPYCVPMGVVA